MNKKITNIIALTLILLSINLFSGCTGNEQAQETEQNTNTTDTSENQPQEDFSFYNTEGLTKQLSDYRGKIVILDMWATWCSPCQYQMLELRKIYQHYEESQVQILSIDIYESETLDQIKEFKQEFADYGYSLDWTFGKEKDSLNTYMPEGSIPTLAIFDQNGALVYRHAGLSFFEEIPAEYPADQTPPPLLKEKIDNLLK